MGKVKREKKHVGVHRSAGAFSAAEVQAAKQDSMDVDMGASNPTAKTSQDANSRRGSVVLKRTALPERRKSVSVAAAQSSGTPAPPLSRGQRKRLARKVGVQRRREMGELMIEKDAVKQEGTLGDLETLAASLQAAQAHSTSPASKGRSDARSVKMTKNNRRRMLINETAQLQAVLQHPSFKANPLATIHQHLENAMRSDAGTAR